MSIGGHGGCDFRFSNVDFRFVTMRAQIANRWILEFYGTGMVREWGQPGKGRENPGQSHFIKDKPKSSRPTEEASADGLGMHGPAAGTGGDVLIAQPVAQFGIPRSRYCLDALGQRASLRRARGLFVIGVFSGHVWLLSGRQAESRATHWPPQPEAPSACISRLRIQ